VQFERGPGAGADLGLGHGAVFDLLCADAVLLQVDGSIGTASKEQKEAER
jgi:hypothetical protein